MQINLSNHTKIKVEAINDKLHLTLYEIMKGIIPKDEVLKLIKKLLNIPENNIHISSKDKDLIIKIMDSPKLPDQHEIIDIISAVLSQILPLYLKNSITERNLIYITEKSGIPLMGSIYFGIIDRGTNLIQVRPITGCLLNCPFCSVDEGKRSKTRFTDYIISASYLIEETKNIIDYKGISDVEIHIDGQSEPTLYPFLPELITEFAKDPRIDVISMQTNGVPLNSNYLQKLEQSGLTRINLSINSLNPKLAQYLAGSATYDIEHIKQIANHIANSSIKLLVSPLWIPGINDEDVQEIIQFVLDLNIKSNFPILGIQNYLKYKFGRKMHAVKMANKKKFHDKLREWEESFDIHPLLLSPKDFGTHPAKTYPKALKKGGKIEAEIIIPGRISSKYENRQEMIGRANNRLIQIMNSKSQIGDRVLVKITNNKDNINYASEIYH
ncbi:MAG: radical SAM protein [Candidatus Helarchaeota archaeon]|nr:radical SAM protein [Candidatus Helarchaeota archaeon]